MSEFLSLDAFVFVLLLLSVFMTANKKPEIKNNNDSEDESDLKK